MPRVEVTVRGSARGEVDAQGLQRALAEIIKNITGGSCQVIVNTDKSSTISNRILASQGRSSDNIYNSR